MESCVFILNVKDMRRIFLFVEAYSDCRCFYPDCRNCVDYIGIILGSPGGVLRADLGSGEAGQAVQCIT